MAQKRNPELSKQTPGLGASASEMSLTSLILLLLSGLLFLFALDCQVDDQNDDLLVEEKNWMPWPTSLKDPKKDYVTETLDAITDTQISTITSIARVTKTVFSHTTLYTTVESEKVTTSSITEIVSKMVTKTVSSTAVEKITVTSLYSTTTTLTQTWTVTFEAGQQIPPARHKIISAHIIDEETSIVLKRPINTSTYTKTSIVQGKTTIRGQTTVTLTTNRVVTKTTVEPSSVTFSSTIVEWQIVTTTSIHFI
jgi:hypothetical protein